MSHGVACGGETAEGRFEGKSWSDGRRRLAAAQPGPTRAASMLSTGSAADASGQRSPAPPTQPPRGRAGGRPTQAHDSRCVWLWPLPPRAFSRRIGPSHGSPSASPASSTTSLRRPARPSTPLHAPPPPQPRARSPPTLHREPFLRLAVSRASAPPASAWHELFPHVGWPRLCRRLRDAFASSRWNRHQHPWSALRIAVSLCRQTASLTGCLVGGSDRPSVCPSCTPEPRGPKHACCTVYERHRCAHPGNRCSKTVPSQAACCRMLRSPAELCASRQFPLPHGMNSGRSCASF